jgi:hypothetical protein
MKLAEICRHSPLSHHGTRTAIRLSEPAREHTSAIQIFFAAIVTIAVVLAIPGWPNDRNLTSVLNATVALWRTWYVLSKFQEKLSSRSCKTPHNRHHFLHHHNCFCPPCHRQKKMSLITPPNNNKCLGEQVPPLSLTSHQHNAQLQNRHPQQPWPNLGDKLGTTIFPTGGQTVLYQSLTWQMGNLEMLPWVLCLPFRPSHSVFHTRCSPWLNLPFMTAFIAPSSISPKTVAIHLTSPISILPPSQKAILPATRSHLLPPPWLSCSQAAAARPHPPPWPSCSSSAGTTLAATTVVTLTPLGLTTVKATGQAIGHRTATLTGLVTTQAIHTQLGLVPGRATDLLGKANEAAQASTIARRMMARSHKAAAVAAQAAKDR